MSLYDGYGKPVNEAAPLILWGHINCARAFVDLWRNDGLGYHRQPRTAVVYVAGVPERLARKVVCLRLGRNQLLKKTREPDEHGGIVRKPDAHLPSF